MKKRRKLEAEDEVKVKWKDDGNDAKYEEE